MHQPAGATREDATARMKVAAVMSDLMLFSRIESAASAADAALLRGDDPRAVPSGVELVLIGWSAREASWVEALRKLRDAGARIILFGPHVGLDAHAAARRAGLAPMRARSKVSGALLRLFEVERAPRR